MLRIMIAVDGSALSLDAVHHALDLVRRGGLQATLVLGHVQEEASLLELATQGADAVAQASIRAGTHLLQDAVALVQAAGVSYETELGLGPVAATLVDMVERCGCDALIVGARGLGGLRGAFLGSVSQQLVHLSPVPVTVVKHAEPQEAEDAGAAEGAAPL
ncbi:universal stress protein [Melaminivora alkalimesophila]|uniref:Nucleotide-binding universal stress UspA family protein n=1 Tax=Melaminivora alkalimesophila TaxID=1165852 RepID=A0A317R8F0_9BURK|nr:universal stress protein [Melaminivora alkalimesophila]PWW44368.1 nucleotide-binding universal stress UspA family protein [Melaminivora alkalimesophila]